MATWRDYSTKQLGLKDNASSSNRYFAYKRLNSQGRLPSLNTNNTSTQTTGVTNPQPYNGQSLSYGSTSSGGSGGGGQSEKPQIIKQEVDLTPIANMIKSMSSTYGKQFNTINQSIANSNQMMGKYMNQMNNNFNTLSNQTNKGLSQLNGSFNKGLNGLGNRFNRLGTTIASQKNNSIVDSGNIKTQKYGTGGSIGSSRLNAISRNLTNDLWANKYKGGNA